MARRFASPMLSRIAAQKDAEHASQAALESMARLKTSRAAGLAPAPKAAGAGNSDLSRSAPPGGVLRTAQTASSHTPNRKPKSSHSANTARTARFIATFHGTKLVRGRSCRVGEMTGARGLDCDMVFVGYVPKHGVKMVWGNNEGLGGGWGVCLGEREKTDTHRKGKQTTKKWVVDGTG
jgi:hypothetical protein